MQVSDVVYLYSLDLCPELFQSSVDILISSVYLVDVVDY